MDSISSLNVGGDQPLGSVESKKAVSESGSPSILSKKLSWLSSIFPSPLKFSAKSIIKKVLIGAAILGGSALLIAAGAGLVAAGAGIIGIALIGIAATVAVGYIGYQVGSLGANRKMGAMKKNLEAALNDNTTLEKSNVALQEKVKGLEQERDQLQSKLESQGVELQQAKIKDGDAKLLNQRLQEQVRNLTEMLEKASEETETFRKKSEEAKKKSEEMEKLNESLNQFIVDGFENPVDTLTAVHEAFLAEKGKFVELNMTLKDALETGAKANESINVSLEGLGTMEKTLEAQKQALLESRERLEKAIGQNVAMSQSLGNLRVIIESMAEEIENQEKIIEQQKQSLEGALKEANSGSIGHAAVAALTVGAIGAAFLALGPVSATAIGTVYALSQTLGGFRHLINRWTAKTEPQEDLKEEVQNLESPKESKTGKTKDGRGVGQVDAPKDETSTGWLGRISSGLWSMFPSNPFKIEIGPIDLGEELLV